MLHLQGDESMPTCASECSPAAEVSCKPRSTSIQNGHVAAVNAVTL